MSIELVKEVLHNSPDGLDGTARLLLVVLAEMSQDKDRKDDQGKTIPARTCWPSPALLMKRTGITSARGLKLVYERLAKHGLDPRIRIGTDKKGQAVYAWHGTSTQFRVPVMGPAAVDVAADGVKGGSSVSPSGDGGGTLVPPTSSEGGTTVPRRRNYRSARGELQFPPNHKEPELTFPAPQPDRTVTQLTFARRNGEEDLILQDLTSLGMALAESRAVLECAKQDPTTTTSVRGRLQQPAYLSQCRQAVKADRAKSYGAGPKCLDHPSEVAKNCRSCNADWKAGERDSRFIGKHQPQCSICFDPLVNYPQSATSCHDHAEAVSA